MANRQVTYVIPIVERLKALYHACLVSGVLFIFSRGHWLSGDSAVDDIVARAEPETTRKDRAEIRDLLVHTAPKRDYANARYIGFENGDLDIQTMDLLPQSPERIVPNRLPWRWNPDARSQAVEDYLDSTANGVVATRRRIEEMLGSCLYRQALGSVFLLLGKAPVAGGSASNGKSTLLGVISRLVGSGNVCTVSLTSIGSHFLTKNLQGALVYAPDDATAARVPPESLEAIKKAATGERLEVDVKYAKDPLRFHPYATPIASMNKIAGGLASDGGLRRRLAPIVLTGQFDGSAPDPLETLDDPKAMEALATVAVGGLRRLLEDGLTPSPDADSVKLEVELGDSAVRQWAEEGEVCEADLVGKPCSSVYASFSAWSASAGIEHPLPRYRFNQEVSELFPGIERRKHRPSRGANPTDCWLRRP